MDILNNIRYGVELERSQMPDNGLNESPGLLNSILGGISGATEEGVQRKRTAQKSAIDKAKHGGNYTAATGKEWGKGMTAGQALNEIEEANYNRGNDRFDNSPQGKAFKASQKKSDDAHSLAQQGLTAQIQNSHNQMELARMESAKNDKRYYADRIDAREARADDLMFRRESMERADRKDEKNRRRESIQALVAGLSSLGAAFAV